MDQHQQPWMPQQTMSRPSTYSADDSGIQVRPMCLKVHYTFDKDAQVRCLARWPQVLQIRTAALDEHNVIGLVELATCLQAVTQGSPEIVNQPDFDYTVYAYDYTEPDTPLVGQGMLAWALGGNNDSQSPPMLTGRVTRNPLAVFSSGVRETLEVRLKLTAVPKTQRAAPAAVSDPQGVQMSAPTPTPTDTNEWNAFLQSNPTLGRSGPVVSIPSPAPFPSHAPSPVSFHQPASSAPAPPSGFMPSPRPFAPSRRGSLPPPVLEPLLSPAIEMARFAPSDEPSVPPPPATTQQANNQPARPARARSRAPKKPTGNPVGRPRRRPRPDSSNNGNTSAAEEVTDAEEGPQKKRAKTTVADWPSSGPFGANPESLRVAASTSGSLRNMRPVAAAQEPTAASHLQEIPRAPTPIPEGPPAKKPRKTQRKAPARSRRQTAIESELDSPPAEQQPANAELEVPPALSQDARSPADSVAAAASPDQNHTPADSPADVASSPPVPRTAAYMHSSPPVHSSPVLPPMSHPLLQPDSGFMSGGFDDFLEEEEIPQELPPAAHPSKKIPEAVMEDAAPMTNTAFSEAVSRPVENTLQFHEENPGPPERLPTTSLFNPHRTVKRLNNPNAKPRPASRQLTRAHTEPISVLPDSGLPSDAPAQVCDPLPDFVVPPNPLNGRATSADFTGDLQGLALPERITTLESKGMATLLQDTQSQNGVVVAPGLLDQAIIIDDDAEQPSQTEALDAAAIRISREFPAIPASDPVMALFAGLPQTFHSEAPCPASDAGDSSRLSKNYVKKQTIKERLQEAIERGEMPPFCRNCGAIETPTWRKIWTQDHRGAPEYTEYSEKPGHVTAIEVLERDGSGKPTMYKLIKKTLGLQDDKSQWNELLLCNPCGIWLAKFKTHRPPDRWAADAARLNQTRKKSQSAGNGSRSRRSRTKSDGQINPTSEAYFTTDPVGPGDCDEADSPQDHETGAISLDEGTQSLAREDSSSEPVNKGLRVGRPGIPSLVGSPRSLGLGSTLGSTHSRASRNSGAVDSPIAIEDDDLGATRRLLFPSPRRDGALKVLGEVAVNVVHTGHNPVSPKGAMAEKENLLSVHDCPETPPFMYHDALLDQELFGTPPVRPSTPPSKASAGGGPVPFKTPTRATPGQHRPITRSISRTIQSVKFVAQTPSQLDQLLLQTPSKSSSSREGRTRSSTMLKKRTPKMTSHHQYVPGHFALDEDAHAASHFDSPFTTTLHQLLSEAHDFTAGSSSHGLADLDLASLPNLDSEMDVHDHLTGAGGAMDFSQLFSTDVVMPSSPPLLRSGSGSGSGSSALSGMTLDTSVSGTDAGAQAAERGQAGSESQEK